FVPMTVSRFQRFARRLGFVRRQISQDLGWRLVRHAWPHRFVRESVDARPERATRAGPTRAGPIARALRRRAWWRACCLDRTWRLWPREIALGGWKVIAKRSSCEALKPITIHRFIFAGQSR